MQFTSRLHGYNDLIDGSDIYIYDYIEDQVIMGGSLRYPDLVHDEIVEKYRLRLQNIYTQFINSHGYLHEQLRLSPTYQQELHADPCAAEHECERLVSTLKESDKKQWGAKARCAKVEVIMSKLCADLTAAMNHLDRQTEVVSSNDHAPPSTLQPLS
jgi:hypothetical protein